MSREFKITNASASSSGLGKARLDLHEDGDYPTHVSIEVEQTYFFPLVWVCASVWTRDGELHNTVMSFHSVREGWKYFQSLRELLGLKGV